MACRDQESARQRVIRVHPECGAAESGSGRERAVPDQPDEARDEALVSFVRGTLPSAEAARITAEAADRPGLAAEIALLRGIAAAVDAEASAPAPGELGWARLSRALDAEPRRYRPPIRRLWPLAASAAAAILVWQVLAVPFLARPKWRCPILAGVGAAPGRPHSVGGLRACCHGRSDPGAVAGDRRPDHGRTERGRPVAAQLRWRRVTQLGPRPASGRRDRRKCPGKLASPSGDPEPGEAVHQQALGVQDAGLDRANRHAFDLGNVAVGQLLIECQMDR